EWAHHTVTRAMHARVTVNPEGDPVMDVENRSIEFIPHGERYGTPKRLFTIWFSANMQVTALVVGTLGIVAGMSLAWTLVA
ncbi:cytosine permease, partial [Burkholderia sp. SIMBA_062]|uniref:cytosine permease n=1 Tax=Burkholderia sp. SIMBA_062 TaxID=3085803 RepID=UPI003979A031